MCVGATTRVFGNVSDSAFAAGSGLLRAAAHEPHHPNPRRPGTSPTSAPTSARDPLNDEFRISRTGSPHHEFWTNETLVPIRGGEEFPSADVCIAAHMASRKRCARVPLLTIALVAAAGAASGDCARATAVRSSRLVGRRPRSVIPVDAAGLVEGGELHDAARAGDLAAVEARPPASTVSGSCSSALSRPSAAEAADSWLVLAADSWLVFGPAVSERERR